MKTQTLLASVVAMGWGCSSKSVKELDEYVYSVTVEQDMAAGWISSDFTLRVGDRAFKSTQGRINVPKAVWLTRSKLAIVLDTSCGPIEAPLTNVYSDEAQMRQSAARYDQAVFWKLKPEKPIEVKHVGVIVDNLENPSPVSVRVGTIRKEIAAKSRDSLGGMLGTCATANEIAIGDKVLGAASEGSNTLVDAMGTHCYATTTDSYGAMAEPSTRDVLEPYAPGLYALGQIDNWFVPNPTSTTVRVRDNEIDKAAAGKSLTSLMHTACDPKAARRRR